MSANPAGRGTDLRELGTIKEPNYLGLRELGGFGIDNSAPVLGVVISTLFVSFTGVMFYISISGESAFVLSFL